MSLSVKIPIVEKIKISRIFSTIFIISFVSFFISIIYVDSKIINLILVVIFLIFCIIFSFKKGYVISGYFILDTDMIGITTNEFDCQFPLEELDNLKFKYSGYNGENYTFNLSAIRVKDGTGNFIEFFHKGKKYSFELLYEELSLRILNRVIDSIRNKIDIKLVGEWGFKRKNL